MKGIIRAIVNTAGTLTETGLMGYGGYCLYLLSPWYALGAGVPVLAKEVWDGIDLVIEARDVRRVMQDFGVNKEVAKAAIATSSEFGVDVGTVVGFATTALGEGAVKAAAPRKSKAASA